MRRSRLLLVAASCALISACSYKPGFINEYKIDIQQGNVLTQEMVSQLKPGQTRDQVRFLLGTPLVVDIFHQQRWDYVYRYQNGQTGAVESRKFTVYFDREDRLASVAGDIAEGNAGELNAPLNKSRLVDLGSLTPEQADKPLPPREQPSYYRRFMDMIGF
ncbi:MAG: outer membrane protein assembly factor BamE [Betaproteobacteria bacterium]|jgi:outer membrane protein assembly factor BamE|nr:outer membrane protein assembly factor BamE [Betaproteobacteria bacterium]MBP6204231.1 outer membrane protein assembly factor BamE [Azonexus sp.]MBP8170552.1 outer membrane protein assembly factor BamE [Azonexus sp.]